jgi:dihydrolipoamide dehydrogenase
MQKYDLIVIGGGPGGYVAAIRAAQLGAKVALIEKDRIGGTCLNRGCIPTKAIIACVALYEKIQKAQTFGIKCEQPSLDIEKVIDRKNQVVEKVVKGVEFLLAKNKVDIINGTAKVLAPGKIEIEKKDGTKQTAESEKLILATGSSPAGIPNLAIDGKQYVSSDDILEYRRVPQKLDVVGGGVIGLHFAYIYSSLGTQVNIHEALPEILPGIDEEVIMRVKRILKRRNISIHTGARFSAEMSCGMSMVCVGRVPNIDGINDLNLKMERKSVWVNEKMETSIPGIYAVGDLASKKLFAHVAYEQGTVAAENALGGNRSFTYDCVPYAIYIHPEVAAVGLTEKEAREKHGEIKVGRYPYSALGIAQAMGEPEGFIKVICDKDQKLLGVHIFGAEATTLIGSATIALKNKLSVNQLADTFQAHPSYPEGLQEAALHTLSRALHALN